MLSEQESKVTDGIKGAHQLALSRDHILWSYQVDPM